MSRSLFAFLGLALGLRAFARKSSVSVASSSGVSAGSLPSRLKPKNVDFVIPSKNVQANPVLAIPSPVSEIKIRFPFFGLTIPNPYILPSGVDITQPVGGITLNQWLEWSSLPDVSVVPVPPTYEYDRDPKGANIPRYVYSAGNITGHTYTPREYRFKKSLPASSGPILSAVRFVQAVNDDLKFRNWPDLVTVKGSVIYPPYRFRLDDAHTNYSTVLGNGWYLCPLWFVEYVDSLLNSAAGTQTSLLSDPDFVGRILRENVLSNLVNVNLPNFWIRANCGWQNPLRSYYCPPLIRGMVAYCFFRMSALGRSYDNFPHLKADDVALGANSSDNKIMPKNVRPDGTISVGVTDFLTPLFSKMFSSALVGFASDRLLKNFSSNLKNSLKL